MKHRWPGSLYTETFSCSRSRSISAKKWKFMIIHDYRSHSKVHVGFCFIFYRLRRSSPEKELASSIKFLKKDFHPFCTVRTCSRNMKPCFTCFMTSMNEYPNKCQRNPSVFQLPDSPKRYCCNNENQVFFCWITYVEFLAVIQQFESRVW